MRVVVAEPEVFGLEMCRVFLVLCGAFRAPVVGLPTGRTPLPLYGMLRDRSKMWEISLARFEAPFAVDEYRVADAGSVCTNRAYFGQHWNAIPNTKPVRGFDPAAADGVAEAERYAAELAEAGGLDLAVLGIGANGHVAFNEPGSTPEDGTRVVTLSEETRRADGGCFGADVPLEGFTLGLKELMAAKRVLLLANGKAKAEVVRWALEGPVRPECPASYLRDHPDLTVVLDSAAAELLKEETIYPEPS